MFVFVGNSRWVACVQDRNHQMPTAIRVMVSSCSTAFKFANQTRTASATTGFSAATLPHLLIAVLAIAGVMAMGAGGLLLFGSGFSAASQSHVGPSLASLPVTSFTVTGVRWGNESWIGDFLRGASSPSRSLAGSALLTKRKLQWCCNLCPLHDSHCCSGYTRDAPSTR